MNDKRYISTELMRLVFQALLYLLSFLAFFGLLSIKNPAILNISRTAATTMATFAISIAMLTSVYGGYSLGSRKKRSVIAGIVLSMVFTDCITYVLLQIMNVNPQNPEANATLILFGEDVWLLLLAMVLQFGLVYFFVVFGYVCHDNLNPPQNGIIITSTQEMADHISSKLTGYHKRYRIKDVLHYDCPDVKKTIRANEVVFLAGIPDTEEALLQAYCYKHNKAIFMMAELEDVIISSATQHIMDDTPFLYIRRMQPSLMQRIGKRTMDIFFSLIGLIVTSPILLVAALALKCSHQGSVIFHQKRATQNGDSFTIYKFRTMFQNSDAEANPVSAKEGDARITPLGKFLRRYRIDELPQLFNVLKGDMSLVGPRPEMLENVDKYTKEVPEFRYRQLMKAGITGLAQIEGKYNTTPRDKVILDLLYIENFTLAYDCKLILRTLLIFFRRDSTEGFTDKKVAYRPMRTVAHTTGEINDNKENDKEEEKFMKKTLLIMAAGMGSRYGGDKQIDGMGPNNEVLMLYTIFDAIKAGFTKVVFVIKHDFEERFRKMVGDVVSPYVEVAYAFQTLTDLPQGCTVPAQRTKPLGTVQAVLAAKDLIHEPFAVLNADDYYGTTAFPIMANYLDKLAQTNQACMVGYYLKNTISENGHVTRGVCDVDAQGKLTGVTETYKIQPFPDGTIRDTEKNAEGIILNPESLVSMNFFGFTPWIFTVATERLKDFLNTKAQEDLKAEYVLPVLVDELMKADELKVDVLSTDAVWFGVTYQEDKPYVQGELRKMHEKGVYPNTLF